MTTTLVVDFGLANSIRDFAQNLKPLGDQGPESRHIDSDRIEGSASIALGETVAAGRRPVEHLGNGISARFLEGPAQNSGPTPPGRRQDW